MRLQGDKDIWSPPLEMVEKKVFLRSEFLPGIQHTGRKFPGLCLVTQPKIVPHYFFFTILLKMFD